MAENIVFVAIDWSRLASAWRFDFFPGIGPAAMRGNGHVVETATGSQSTNRAVACGCNGRASIDKLSGARQAFQPVLVETDIHAGGFSVRPREFRDHDRRSETGCCFSFTVPRCRASVLAGAAHRRLQPFIYASTFVGFVAAWPVAP